MKDRLSQALINDQQVTREEFDKALDKELSSIHTMITDMIKYPPLNKAIKEAYWTNYLTVRDKMLKEQVPLFEEGQSNVR